MAAPNTRLYCILDIYASSTNLEPQIILEREELIEALRGEISLTPNQRRIAQHRLERQRYAAPRELK